MKPATAPLTKRPHDHTIAFEAGRPLPVGEFLKRVHGLAAELPDGTHVFNLCRDRLMFLLAFCAVVVRGQTNVLPSSALPSALDAARDRLGDGALLHDGHATGMTGPFIDVRAAGKRIRDAQVPEIALTHPCAVAFTSGTTGASSDVRKSWDTICASTACNASAYLGEPEKRWNVLATVPPQHMYGLETSIFLPLQANVVIHPGKPLFAADVADALSAMPSPRVLVTTPLHARALVASSTPYPPVEIVLCATAPLDPALAQAIEARFGATLREVYGSSESGSIATRHTATETDWTLMTGFRGEQLDNGQTRVEAVHLPDPVVLQDLIEWQDDRRFRLRGRTSDMINIAGRRGSLAELNAQLLAVPGVLDGVVFEPDADGEVSRLAALVVAPGLTREAIGAELRRHVADVFVPRPLLLVDALPRNETGKLPRRQLLEYFARQRQR